MNNSIFLTKEGEKELKKNLKIHEIELEQIEKEMTDTMRSNPGDGAHDNAAFENLLRHSQIKKAMIQEIKLKLKNIKIVKDTYEKGKVNIGDIIKIKIGNKKPFKVKLVGTEGNPFNDEISLNSPLGESIKGKKEKDIFTYIVEDKEITGEIIAIEN